jgi:beta-glucosidase
VTLRRFPDGFLWGAATSSHQVEGGNVHNDWWRFEQQGKVDNGDVSGDAVDHWNRFEGDYDLAVELGHNAHRLSIEWSRVEPRPGEYDPAAWAHYREMLAALKARGMTVFLTLHHFTVPTWFADAGAWLMPESPALFAGFARDAARELGDLVDFWITINEPMHYLTQAYFRGEWPPETADFFKAHEVGVNLFRAHNLAYEIIKAERPDARVGASVNAIRVSPCGEPSLLELVSEPFASWFVNYWFLDKTRNHLDFIGTQYYMAESALAILEGYERPEVEEHGPRTDMGWRIYPAGIGEAVLETYRRYGVPIYITENGIADADDDLRGWYIHSHLVELHKAIEAGADVRGYLHWSLLDNFEWKYGWAPEFGLIHVDRATQERIVRESARSYAEVIRANAIEDPAP